MRKSLLTTLAIAAALVPAQAQLNGNGYYRIKNKSTGQYATLASDEMSYQTAIDGVGGKNLLADMDGLFSKTPKNPSKNGAVPTVLAKISCYLQNDIRPVEDGMVSPASVFYLEKSSSQYNLKAEGTDLKTITTGSYSATITVNFPGFYTTINSLGNNLYNLYIPVEAKAYSVVTVTMGNYYFCDNSGIFGIEKDARSKDEAQWTIEPATTFTVAPDNNADAAGHYWATMCVDFPFSIPTSGSTVVAAYTVTGKDANGKAVLSKVSGTIAGGTPVVLECSSADASTNILNIETKTAPASKSCATGKSVSGADGNYLKGRYFDAPAAKYTYKNYLNQVNSPKDATLSTTGNFLTTDATNYRVLAVKNGIVGFYKVPSTLATMPANEAFINISDLGDGTATAGDGGQAVIIEGVSKYTLANIIKISSVDDDVTVVDGDLTAVAFGNNNVLYCKDNKAYASPDECQDGQVDYIKERTSLQSRAYDQSNWVALSLSETQASSLINNNVINHVINGVKGTFVDKVNPTVKLTVAPTVGQESTYTPNTYIAASFGGTQTGTQGKHDQYFFVTPKPCEVAIITWAMWDGSKMVAPTHVDGKVNQAGLSGEFAYGGDQSKLKENSIYRFKGIVKVNTASSKAGKLSAPAASGYTVYPLTQPVEIGSIDGNVVTAVGSVNEAAAVARVIYYNLQGQSSAKPHEGVNIVKTVYTDGSTRVDKVVK